MHYNKKLKIGEKNDEEERQYRVGNDDSQESAFGRNEVKQELGEVDGAPALLTDLKESDRTHHAKLRLYTAVQTLEHDFFPRVRFSMHEVSWWDMTVVDGRLALVGEEFAVEMKGWALVKVVDDRCSPQTIVTRCTLYQQNCISHGIYFVPLSLARKYSRSEKPKIIWFFAHLFVPLYPK